MVFFSFFLFCHINPKTYIGRCGLIRVNQFNIVYHNTNINKFILFNFKFILKCIKNNYSKEYCVNEYNITNIIIPIKFFILFLLYLW